MKKILVITLFICTLLFSLTGCGKDEVSYLPYIGQPSDIVFKELDLSDDDVKPIDTPIENKVSEWKVKNAKTILDKDFSVCLNFDINGDVLYGFYYYLDIDKPTKEDYELINELLNNITEQYGEPDTYEGLKNRITKIDDFKTLLKNKTYVERWNIENIEDTIVELNLIIGEDGSMHIEIRYQLFKLPN